MTDRLKAYFEARRVLVEKALEAHVPAEGVLGRSMRHSLLSSGKRLRPILVLAAAEACGAEPASALPTACAAELIHTYSLVHDDLPAMDDDDERRGRPANHKLFGEAIAILAGDALLTRAFELAALNARIKGVRAEDVIEAVSVLAAAAGSRGMVGGQADDVLAADDEGLGEPGAVTPEALLSIHRRKTGALIAGCLESGAVLARASSRRRAALAAYGRELGLTFQITDDLLDLGETSPMTFPRVHGVERSRRLARQATAKALAALEPLGRRAWMLRDLADYVLRRES